MNSVVQFLKSSLRLSNRNGTVRYMFPALISIVAMMSASVITSKDISYIRLETSNSTIEAGSQFSIDVFAYAHVPVNAVDVTLKFDPKAVEVLGVDRGQSVLTIWTKDPVIENGKVILQGGTYRKGFLEEHLIATVNVRAKKTGQSSFETAEVMLLAGDGAGSQVSVTNSNDSTVNLYVYDENTSPESIGVNVEVNLVTDIDGDGKVTLKDVSSFMAAWHKKNKLYDFNGDGRMTFKDFSIILANFFF